MEHVPNLEPKAFYALEDMIAMPPYMNVAVQMFGTGCHPYNQDGAALGDADLARAEQALQMFVVVGLTEAPKSSWLLLTRFFGICDNAPAALRTADALNVQSKKQKKKTVEEAGPLLDKAHRANALDDRLYKAAARILCERLSAAGLSGHPVVQQELYGNSSINCGQVSSL